MAVVSQCAGAIVHNDERAMLENMDLLPFVTPVYKRDLDIDNYFIGYLQHPYLQSTPAADANRDAPSACGRKPSAAIATARARSDTSSRRSPGRRRHFPGEGILFRRRHVHG